MWPLARFVVGRVLGARPSSHNFVKHEEAKSYMGIP